jgi:hypothetical protein
MSGIFFDSSTLISMATTCSLPVLRKLRQAYGDNFYITNSVYEETIGRAMHSLRFRYEGYRLKELIDDGILKIYPDSQLRGQVNEMLTFINATYFASGRPITIVQPGEISTIVASVRENADTFAVDERTARLLIENPSALKPWLEHKLHTTITVNSKTMTQWSSKISEKFIPLRSAEFALAAWEKGIFGNDPDVLFGLLWALKFAGCAITEEEINFYMRKTGNRNGQT